MPGKTTRAVARAAAFGSPSAVSSALAPFRPTAVLAKRPQTVAVVLVGGLPCISQATTLPEPCAHAATPGQLGAVPAPSIPRLQLKLSAMSLLKTAVTKER